MTSDTDPRNKVLDLLANGKITAEEAKHLLALVSGAATPEPPGPETGGGDRARGGRDRSRRDRARRRGDLRDHYREGSGGAYIRVRVDPRVDAGADPNADRLNIRVPIGLIKAGALLTSLIPGPAADRVTEALGERGIDLDFKNLNAERLDEILADGGFAIDITEGDVRIRISVE
ncbi:MAG: hypothetical protein QF554_11540 [Dehalococcoidia bacterium]|jgi:hypothetical protein|nr:hypothetical protein [Dehalococcoidia bacterium]